MPVEFGNYGTQPKKKRSKPAVSPTRSTRFREINNAGTDVGFPSRESLDEATKLTLQYGLGSNQPNPFTNPQPAASPASGYSYGYGRGGGGGGGGGGPSTDFKGQVDFLTQLLNSGAYDPSKLDYTDKAKRRKYVRDNAIYGRVAQGVSADRANARSAYDTLDQYLANVGPNPYVGANRTAAPRADVSLLNLLSSQGVDPSAYQAEAYSLQRQGQGSSDVFDRLLATLAMNERSSRQSRQAESQQARTFADRELSAQKLGLDTALDLREQARRQAIEDQNFGIDQSELARQRQVQDANAQLALQAQQAKLALIQQLSTLAAQGSVDQPTLEALGIR